MRIQEGIKGAEIAFKLRTNCQAPFWVTRRVFHVAEANPVPTSGHVIWIELRFATDGRDTRRADNAVHDQVRELHTLRPELARERLHQAT